MGHRDPNAAENDTNRLASDATSTTLQFIKNAISVKHNKISMPVGFLHL